MRRKTRLEDCIREQCFGYKGSTNGNCIVQKPWIPSHLEPTVEYNGSMSTCGVVVITPDFESGDREFKPRQVLATFWKASAFGCKRGLFFFFITVHPVWRLHEEEHIHQLHFRGSNPSCDTSGFSCRILIELLRPACSAWNL